MSPWDSSQGVIEPKFFTSSQGLGHELRLLDQISKMRSTEAGGERSVERKIPLDGSLFRSCRNKLSAH